MHSVDTIDALVFDWLIRSGYHSTFSKLPTQIYAQSQSQASFLSARAEIVKLIKRGRIQEALDFIQREYNGQVLGDQILTDIGVDSFKNIEGPLDLFACIFLLKLQNFIEIIRQKNVSMALNYIQGHLLPFCQSNSSFQAVLQDVLGVLVYADPESSPMAWCFERTRRYSALASLVNSSLYNLTTKISSAPIESLLKQVHGLDALLQELNGFGSDLDDRKWSTIHSLLNNQQGIKKFIKTIKKE